MKYIHKLNFYNSKTLIEANKDETIKKDSTLTVGKNYIQNIKENQIITVDVDKIVSVKEDYEIEVYKDFNVKVKQDVLQIIENNLNIKINKTNTIFVQNDVKQKYLKNLFQQIVKDYRLDVQENYQLKAKEIKTVVDNIELKSNNGISLRVGFPQSDIIYVMNPVGLANQFNKECGCERNFTVDYAKKALRFIYDTYGRDMAIIVEKIYRDETGNFKSKQYIHCGGAGMESHGKAPYYGWDSKLFKNPPICTWSVFENPGDSAHGGNKQVTDRKKIFIVFDIVLDAMIVKVNYIKKYNGDYAKWHSTNKAEHDHYEKVLKDYIENFAKEFDGEKK